VAGIQKGIEATQGVSIGATVRSLRDGYQSPGTSQGVVMGDWDFLYEMREAGYSDDDIMDAASSGAAPWEWDTVHFDWEGAESDRSEVAPPQSSSGAFRSRNGYPRNFLEQTDIFEDLVECAQRHFDNTGRYLQVWGELGEIFAEIHFGLCRHGTHQAGSDGTIHGKRIEVKTISPEKSNNRVSVKRQGDFEQLLIIRINEEFQFEGRIFDRSELSGETGRLMWKKFDPE
jgi:hypothetical protein